MWCSVTVELCQWVGARLVSSDVLDWRFGDLYRKTVPAENFDQATRPGGPSTEKLLKSRQLYESLVVTLTTRKIYKPCYDGTHIGSGSLGLAS